MTSNQPPTNGPGLALPQDVAQQRAVQQRVRQQVNSMMINISTSVLSQLVNADELRSDWSRQRTNETTESHGARMQLRCDETAGLAVRYAESLLNHLGVMQRPGGGGQ